MKKYFLYFILMQLCFASYAQQNIDKTIAVIGKYIVLRSELERELKGMATNGIKITDSLRCSMLDELMYQKLLLAQADKDSVRVKDEQVDAELDRRMNYYLGQFGSEEKFEAFYGKNVKQYKEEMRDDIHNILVAQQMQQKVVGDIKVSPADVRTYYSSIPSDSLPLINTEVEICQLVKKPVVSDEAKKAAREKLEGYRQRVLNGESMSVIAALYTEDPGSVKTGGRYDGIARGQFVPEFEAVAFRLKPGDVSEIFESAFGYHFLQLIARRGELVDVRHILVTAKVTTQDIMDAKIALDTIYQHIQDGKIDFCKACAKFSDDKDTKNNCGAMQNQGAGSTKFEIEELGQIDQSMVFMLDKMKPGEISKPLINQGQQGQDTKQSFRIIYLKTRSEPHKANLKDDYQRMQGLAQMHKQKSVVNAWVNKKLRSIYVRIDDDYKNCSFTHNWKQASNP
ncbi:MAG TPA: peptidylprolyl isomerase [Bacteroidia bacterium]|nr:peptidylprolyl isomerase [Bacteroidia bacterium]